MSAPEFLAIVGPTASGKTGLSLEVGRQLNGEIISMDSRQIYRGMDVGTGKATLRERSLLPHHGLDIRNPDQRYSAGEFSRDAREWMRGIRSRRRVPILVGGTGFFLKALTDPMFDEPELDQVRLERLRRFLNDLPEDRLSEFVAVLDPEMDGVGEGGRHRATRRVEMALLTGHPLSWWHRETGPSEKPMHGLIILLDLPREALYERINRRVESMMASGLVPEVQRLLDAGYGPEDPGMTGAGYREVIRFLGGELELKDATEEIQRSHRRYARRQITWYRHQLPGQVVVVDASEPSGRMAERVVEEWMNAVGRGSA